MKLTNYLFSYLGRTIVISLIHDFLSQTIICYILSFSSLSLFFLEFFFSCALCSNLLHIVYLAVPSFSLVLFFFKFLLLNIFLLLSCKYPVVLQIKTPSMFPIVLPLRLLTQMSTEINPYTELTPLDFSFFLLTFPQSSIQPQHKTCPCIEHCFVVVNCCLLFLTSSVDEKNIYLLRQLRKKLKNVNP